jgi:hypothetical protein
MLEGFQYVTLLLELSVQITAGTRDYHQLSQYEIGGAKRISFEAAENYQEVSAVGDDLFRHGDFIFSMALVSVTDSAAVASEEKGL